MSRLVATMIDSHLDRGDPDAARALLGELETPPHDLVVRIDRARASKAEEAERLTRLDRDLDPRAGLRTRIVVTMFIGVVWVVTPIVVNALIHAGVLKLQTGLTNLAIPVALLAIVVGLGWFFRREMLRTKINRIVGATAIIGMASNVVGAAVAIFQERPPSEHVHQQLLVFACIASLAAAAVDARLWWIAVSQAVGFVVIPLVGLDNALFVLGVCNVSVLAVAYSWRDKSSEGDRRVTGRSRPG
jgi:hypothetical protein